MSKTRRIEALMSSSKFFLKSENIFYFSKNNQSPCNDPMLYALYGQRLKKCLEMAHKLNTNGFVINCSPNSSNRSLIEADIPNELKNWAKMLKMIYDSKEHCGYRGELVLQCSNTTIDRKDQKLTPNIINVFCLLKAYNLEKHFRLIADNLNESTFLTGYNYYPKATHFVFKLCPFLDVEVQLRELFLESIVEELKITYQLRKVF